MRKDQDELLAASLVGKHVIIQGHRKTGTKNFVIGYKVEDRQFNKPKVSIQLNDGNDVWVAMEDLNEVDYEVEAD